MRKDTDKFLEAHAPFKRYSSFSDAGIQMSELSLGEDEKERIRKETNFYREKFTRLMMPKFKIPARTRSEYGPFVDISEAVDGVPDCFRSYKAKKRAPLRIGINLSRINSSEKIVSIRGAAILALIELCKSRGQNTTVEACYGNGLETVKGRYAAKVCHVRIEMPSPNIDTLTRVTCSRLAIYAVGQKIIGQYDMGQKWIGIYRFHEFEKIKNWPKEYDFFLDRIETEDPAEEEERVTNQLEKFGLI